MMSLRFLCYSLCCWVWFIQILRFNLRVLAVSLPWFLAFTTLPRWKNATILLRPWPLQNRQHPRNFKKPLHQAHKPYSDLQLVQTVQCHFQCSDLQTEVEAPWVPNANMRQRLRMSQNVSAECFIADIADIAKQLGLKASKASKASKAQMWALRQCDPSTPFAQWHDAKSFFWICVFISYAIAAYPNLML